MMRNFLRQEIRNHDTPKITHHGYRCTKKIYSIVIWGIVYIGVYYFSIVKNIPQTGYIFEEKNGVY